MDSPKSKDLDFDEAQRCIDYITGFQQGYLMSDANSLCFGNSSTGTVIRIYVAYMSSHPRFFDNFKGIGVFAALRQEFTCKPGQKP